MTSAGFLSWADKAQVLLCRSRWDELPGEAPCSAGRTVRGGIYPGDGDWEVGVK